MQPEIITVVLQYLIIFSAAGIVFYVLDRIFGLSEAFASAMQERGRRQELAKQAEPAKQERAWRKADPSVLLLAGAILGITLFVVVGGILQIALGN